jgi:16S rRNA (uracil1498-N3)-methyltransferase
VTDASLTTADGPVVYVDDVGRPDLPPDDRHHLTRVLRLRPGAPIVLCDGRGTWRSAVLGEPVAWTADPVSEPRPDPSLSVSVALPKGDRADWLIQKVTEIGIDHIVLIETDFSVVRWNATKVPHHLERLRRIVRAAGAQSRRAWLPDLHGPVPLAEAAAMAGSVFAVPGSGPVPPACRNILIGPEGGWSPAELDGAKATVGLGPQILRVETAALVASTLMVAIRSRLVASPDFGTKTALCG